MADTPKSFTQYQVSILGDLVKTGIRQLAPGGKARAFADAVASKLAELDSREYANLSQTLLPYATGVSLDLLGDIFGVQRIPQQDSSVAAADGNFQFYVRRGTFGAINNGRDIVIPANIRITTLSADGPVYLTDSVVLPASASTQSFAARALDSGSRGNVAAGVFSRHNFTDYADTSYGSLLVTNVNGIVGGRDEEDDESYRYRIHLKLSTQSSVNEAALRFQLLQLPGIQDVVFVPHAGYFYVYLYGITPTVSSQIVTQAQNTLSEYVTYPIVGTCLVPDLVGISLATNIRLTPGTLPAEKDVVAGIARSAAENYINNLGIGEELVINEISDRIRNADSRIMDVGEPNRQIPEIFVWRSRLDGTRYSRFLANNLVVSNGERIVVEPSKSNAINIIPVE
jgi:uncharacterized phage protein gp47/JayE